MVRDGTAVSCTLIDISQSGMAFECDPELRFATGELLPNLTVRFDEHIAYKGVARVGSIRDQDGITIVGVSFERAVDRRRRDPRS